MRRYILQGSKASAIFYLVVAVVGGIILCVIEPSFCGELSYSFPLIFIVVIVAAIVGGVGGAFAALVDRVIPSNFIKKYGGALFGILSIAIIYAWPLIF